MYICLSVIFFGSHVFGMQTQIAGHLILRTAGKLRAEINRNPAYNVHSVGQLCSMQEMSSRKSAEEIQPASYRKRLEMGRPI
jgi:hypothetical protein